MPTGSYDEVEAASPATASTVYRVQRRRRRAAGDREVEPDLVILDLQIGNMGGMAACMTIRHEEGMGRIPITAVLMLLDRPPTRSWPAGRRRRLAHQAARRVPPARAADVLLDGYSYFEGVDEETDLAEGEIVEA